MGERYLTLDEAAEMAGVSRRTLGKWRSEEGLPYVRIGQIVRIFEDDLHEFMDAQKESHGRRQFT